MSDIRCLRKLLDALEMLFVVPVSINDKTDTTNGGLANVLVGHT